MARDTHIIRPDRLIRPVQAQRQEWTRQERIQLLVRQILPDVCAAFERKVPVRPVKR